MQNGVSGWYARLDRTLADRKQQIDIWLTTWEKSLKTFQPIAALLPEDWPTLPANLLTDPGHVLDHLLARHDAESDGRSPRGAHPTPPRLADAGPGGRVPLRYGDGRAPRVLPRRRRRHGGDVDGRRRVEASDDAHRVRRG